MISVKDRQSETWATADQRDQRQKNEATNAGHQPHPRQRSYCSISNSAITTARSHIGQLLEQPNNRLRISLTIHITRVVDLM